MKTILLWDPRFPDRSPTRLTLDDAIASAAVRAGVAAAANPADAGALTAGGGLDGGTPTETWLQHGFSAQRVQKVILPLAVAQVAAGLGLASGPGLSGGGAGSPTLGALTLSGSLQIGTATSGTISGATNGSTIAGNIPGISVNSGARTYSGTPTGSAATIGNGLVETLAGATGSPRSSSVTVAAAAGGSLTVTPVSGITQDAIAGTVLANITGGTATSLSPNDGRLLLSSDGTKIVKGLSAWSAGTIGVTATPASGSAGTATLTVNANPTYTRLVSNTRLGITQVYNSNGTSTETTSLAASSTAKTKPLVAVAISGTTTIAFKLSEAAPNGVQLNAINVGGAMASYAYAYSTDSTTGSDGTWTAVTALNWIPSGQTDASRGSLQPFPALASGNWVRIVMTGGAAAGSVGLGLFKTNASGTPMDVGVIVGMSIDIQDFNVLNYERYITARIDSGRDPIVINLGCTGAKTNGGSPDMATTQVANVLAPAITAGAPVYYTIDDIGPNDTSAIRPRSSNSSGAATFRTNIDALTAALVTAGVPYARQFVGDMDFYTPSSAPTVTGIASSDNGTTPFNNAEVFAAMKAQAYPATVHAGWDSHQQQHSVMTTMWMESQFVDGTTHPSPAFYPEEWRRTAPVHRYLSGMPAGETYLEARLADSVKGGVTTAYRKQRLLDCIGLLPTTTDPVALAVRAQATAQANALTTTGYADPTGSFTLPSARAHAPSVWLDPSYLPNVTKANSGTSAKMTQLLDRVSSYAFARNTTGGNGGIFYLENHRNGRGVFRCSQASLSPAGLDGEANIRGFLIAPTGAITAIDAASDSTIEWWAADWAIAASVQHFGSTNVSVASTGYLAPIKVSLPSGSTITSSVAPTLGAMHYYALTYVHSTGVWTLYMDGTSVGTVTRSKGAGWTTTVWNIGSNSTGNPAGYAEHGDFILTAGYAMTSGDIADGRAYGQTKFAAL